MKRINEDSRAYARRERIACECHFHPCGKCGSPVIDGHVCAFCGCGLPTRHHRDRESCTDAHARRGNA